MLLGSPAEIIPFTRFLECRQRLQRIAAANGTVVPASSDAGIRPDATGTSNDDDGASPQGASATVSAVLPHGGVGIV